MKTKNNVQKTILKSATVVASLILLSISGNAQIFWRNASENNKLNHIAMAMAEMNAGTGTTATKSRFVLDLASLAKYTAIETENPIELEEWMTNSSNFDANIYNTETKGNKAVELQSWIFEIETEPALELEGWMLKDNFFREEKKFSVNSE